MLMSVMVFGIEIIDANSRILMVLMVFNDGIMVFSSAILNINAIQ